ncbi:MAG: hypothetical protein M0P71_16230 [Melioribacteraceae bacterium]|nr:hypothetical protein [Melioribacteraceae bacterium]
MKTLQDWINFYYPRGGYDWYYKNYPFLKANGFSLPIDQLTLQSFYRMDMIKKNQTPVQTFQDDYEETFIYFLNNYEPTNFSTPTSHNSGIEGFINAIPQGISTTVNQVKNVVNSIGDTIKYVIIAIVVIGIIYFYYTNKK